MRILHTADLHLREDDPATVMGLEELLDVAVSRDVDVLTIAGDVFDTPEDAAALRPTLRNHFADNPFNVIAIPGNHDADAFRGNVAFGPDLELLLEEPCGVITTDDAAIVGVPYRDAMTEELFFALQDAGANADCRVLLLHCTLDVGAGTAETGDEERTYFPIRRKTLDELGYDFVLAGHVHSEVARVALDSGGQFVYPGSPVSHASSETGRRHAVLVDTNAKSATPIELETFYADQFDATVTPGDESDVLQNVEDWASSHDGRHCKLEVSVRGFVSQDEATFDQRLRTAAGSADITNETRSIEALLDHPIYDEFVDRLVDASFDDWENAKHDAVEQRVVEVLAELVETREVRS